MDGDTVHFDVPESVCADGVLKARFLALNTPESTGKIEEYGVAASHFTQEKLASAVSIILESDSDRWELDSTGGRMLVWVWYQPSEGAEYRNLNLELLQNGYARAYSTANNQYGSICSNALDQARQFKLNLYSGQPDPDFYYGDAIELTLRELRCHPEAYQNKKVAFNGIVTLAHNNSVYVESLDAESGIVFGISVYYGFNLSGKGLSILTPGNEVRIVGSVQYYAAGDQWQISDVSYRMMKAERPREHSAAQRRARAVLHRDDACPADGADGADGRKRRGNRLCLCRFGAEHKRRAAQAACAVHQPGRRKQPRVPDRRTGWAADDRNCAVVFRDR